MDLSTSYLGLQLAHPFVAGASPIGDTLDGARRVEDAGAAALVLRSLFEEQLVADAIATEAAHAPHEESFAEALSFAPVPAGFPFGPDEYLERVRSLKEALGIPVIASLNGTTPGGWVRFATEIAAAGADALELNLFEVPVDPELDAAHVEGRSLEVVRSVCAAIEIPVAVKLSPFYTALPHFARSAQRAGARGVVLFNRFYEPELDVEALELRPHATLSSSSELGLRLRWLGILSGVLEGVSLAVTGGVHAPVDAIRALMAGADTVQSVSALLMHGPGRLGVLHRGLEEFLEVQEYESLAQLRGSLDLRRAPDPDAYRRGNYARTLQTWPQEATAWARA